MLTPAAGDWVVVHEAEARGSAAERALVLAAARIEHRIVEHVGGFSLVVRFEAFEAARAELADYQQEVVARPAPPIRRDAVDGGFAGIAGYLLAIWSVPFLQGAASFGADMLTAGRMHAGAVEAGEWWRTVTALTLHADSGHLLSNSAFGAFFGIYVARAFGSGFGWLLVLLAGAAGNGMNALIQADAFRSIGASTATFGALGVFAASAWVRGEIRRGAGWRRGVAPLFAGFAMVVWTGTGGENTDVAAHFTGFGAGVALGALSGRLPERLLGLTTQLASAAITAALLVLAWHLALS